VDSCRPALHRPPELWMGGHGLSTRSSARSRSTAGCPSIDRRQGTNCAPQKRGCGVWPLRLWAARGRFGEGPLPDKRPQIPCPGLEGGDSMSERELKGRAPEEYLPWKPRLRSRVWWMVMPGIPC